MARLVAAADYAPTTVNGWLSILRVVMKAARRKLSLPYLATEGAENLDLSEHATYTEEEPNALLPEEVAPFMSKFKELHAQHFAMTYLGLITGLRPSSLRPLRRRGAEVDVLWDRNRILVRRSQTLGDEVMLTTKQKRRYAVDLPQVNAAEQRDALAKVIRLFDPKAPTTSAPGGREVGRDPRASGEGTKKAG